MGVFLRGFRLIDDVHLVLRVRGPRIHVGSRAFCVVVGVRRKAFRPFSPAVVDGSGLGTPGTPLSIFFIFHYSRIYRKAQYRGHESRPIFKWGRGICALLSRYNELANVRVTSSLLSASSAEGGKSFI